MKIYLTVIDAFGIGAAPDAAIFGDAGANTYVHTAEETGMKLKNLARLGLNHIDGVPFTCADKPEGIYARLEEKSSGKDTTTGHWEIAGLVLSNPFPTYPNGFPQEVMERIEREAGITTLFNGVASGTEIIERYGAECRDTARPIVYTSADSVFQIAAHVDTVPLERLYEICRIARGILRGEHGVGRVIARPFTTKGGKFVRTEDRKDFSLAPFRETMLDKIRKAGLTTYAIGKIDDIFAGQGIVTANHAHGNSACMSALLSAADLDFDGLVFTNLVDTDMLYGHRRDVLGYAKALEEIDAFLPVLRRKLSGDDLMIFTGDHGCDPTYTGTDHTREYVPLLIGGPKVLPQNLGTVRGFDFISRFILSKLGIEE